MAATRKRSRSALWNTEDDPVDLESVREARADLADLLKDNPDLALPENKARLDAYFAKEDATRKTAKPISFRLDEDTARRLEEVARKFSLPGIPLSIADALRMVVAVGLDTLFTEASE